MFQISKTRMVRVLLVVALFVALIPTGSSTASAVPTSRGKMTRAQIKAMPLLERPNRFGHFYGNTIRRRNARQ